MTTAPTVSKRALYSDPGKKPSVLQPVFDSIPDPMKREKRWVLWKLDWVIDKKGKGKWSKVPYRANGRKASSTDPKTWSYFNDIRTAYLNGDCDGIGFVLSDTWSGIDLDDVLVNGELSEEANRIRIRIGSYCEVSPSKSGVKIFCRGYWASSNHKKRLKTGGEIEVYGDGRYFTVTGAKLGDANIADDPTDSQLKLDELAAEFAKWEDKDSDSVTSPPASKPITSPEDHKLIELAKQSKNGAKFAALWSGSTSSHGDDSSRAEPALCMMLAFWANKDASRIDSLFRQSGLYRDKWDEKHGKTTYGERTIKKAIEKTTETYTPPVKILIDGKPITGAAPPMNGDSSLIITRCSDLKARPVKYLVPGRIPVGKLILWAARGGTGKSTLSRSLASDVSAGRCAFGMDYPDPVQGKVLIVAAEDGPADTILPDLLAAGADIDRIALLEGVKHKGVKHSFTLLPEHVNLVRARLKQAPDIILIILDPVASFVGRTRIDDHRGTELRLVLDPLSEMAEEFGVTILLIAHTNKSAGDAIDRIAGSAAYRDTVRAYFLVTEDPEDDQQRVLVPVKENLPGFDRTSVVFGLELLSNTDAATVMNKKQFAELSDEDRGIMRDELRRVRFFAPKKVDANEAVKGKKEDKNKVEKCAEWLKAFLGDYAYPSSEIDAAARKEQFTFDNVSKAKTILKETGLRNTNQGRFGGKWWSGFGHPNDWKLRPEPTPESPDSHDTHYSHETHDNGKTRGSHESHETSETGGTRGLFRDGSGLPD